jgi:hypothetical protein
MLAFGILAELLRFVEVRACSAVLFVTGYSLARFVSG